MFTTGDALDYEVLKQTPDAYDFNITGCRYAQFYKELVFTRSVDPRRMKWI